jgi:hypothetical protein
VESFQEGIGGFGAELADAFQQIMDLGLRDTGQTGKSALRELSIVQFRPEYLDQRVL